MIESLRTVIANILTALYQPFWFALLLAILFMFVWKQNSSVKAAIKQWIRWFKEESNFRWMFVLVFYVTMVLFRTLLNRNMWANPLSDVIGVWGLHKVVDSKEVLTTEAVENFFLFLPFTFLLFKVYASRVLKKNTFQEVIWKSLQISFLFSLIIEMLQLFLRLGTWQLSDLFYNSFGGVISGILYYILCVKHISEKDIKE